MSRGGPQPLSVARAVTVFALTGLVAVGLIGFASIEVLRRQSAREAVDDAKQVTRLAGEGIVAPAVTAAAVAGDPAAQARLDRLVRARVLVNGIVRVKVWTPQGRIVYSDEPRLVGRVYPLTARELSAFRSGRVRAEMTKLDLPENRFERHLGRLLQVYLPIRTRGGPLLFESYQPFTEVTASARRLWVSFAPALVGGLALLELVQLPVALSIARRLRRGQEDRERLLRRAVDSSADERRRIARDLHDAVVQDLAGVSYALAAAAERLGADPPEVTGAQLREATRATRRSIRQLRSLLVEIYPASLHDAGLGAALSDVVARFGGRDVEAQVELDPELDLPGDTEALFFRVAQEALRNAAAHADARHVLVRVARDDDLATLTVSDDGRGFAPEERERRGGEGHLGLDLLADLVRDAGGRLAIESSPGAGTRVRAEVPLS